MPLALAIAAFVIPLGFDTLAVSIALGLRGMQPWRPALLFAAFEVTMPLAGIGLGRYVGARVESLADYLGGIIVIAVGLHALREAFEHEDEIGRFSLRGVRGVLTAGLGVSTDEIAIGFRWEQCGSRWGQYSPRSASRRSWSLRAASSWATRSAGGSDNRLPGFPGSWPGRRLSCWAPG